MGGVGEIKSPLPVLMQKYLAICIKKKSIYVNAFYCINDNVYAYFTMDIIMHICILSFINFNKHYIVHLYHWVNSLYFLECPGDADHTLDSESRSFCLH